MDCLIVDVDRSNAKLTLFRDYIYYWIASPVSEYSHQQTLLKVAADGSTRPHCNASYECWSLGMDIVFHGIWAETDRNKM